MKKTALEKMLDLYHTAANMASVMRDKEGRQYSRQRCDQWIKQGYIPYTQGEAVERATKGKITKLEVWESAAKARHH